VLCVIQLAARSLIVRAHSARAARRAAASVSLLIVARRRSALEHITA
jgi:hypothetical protein